MNTDFVISELERMIGDSIVGRAAIGLIRDASAQNEVAPPMLSARPNEAESLAVKFHDTYERLAPSFGYETRKETRRFDPTTPNGRLMIAVCAVLLNETDAPRGQAVVPTIELLNAAMEAYYAKCGECADAAGLCAALELAQKPSAPRIVVAELVKAARA